MGIVRQLSDLSTTINIDTMWLAFYMVLSMVGYFGALEWDGSRLTFGWGEYGA